METEDRADVELIRRVSAPIYEARGWMKLVGILMILNGVATALTIIGLLVAWLPIWMGLLLFQSASRAEEAYLSGDETTFVESLGKIRTYFTITGIFTLLGLLVGILVFFMFFLGIAASLMSN